MKRRKPEPEISNLRVESGNASLVKAAHREEAQREHLRKSIDERLMTALSMVGPKQRGNDKR